MFFPPVKTRITNNEHFQNYGKAFVITKQCEKLGYRHKDRKIIFVNQKNLSI